MLISRTPYRLSLFGGGIDYPSWYQKRNTQILCAGLDYYCYQTVRELPPFFKHTYRVAYSNIEEVNEIDDIQHPTAREVIRKFGCGKSLEITHVGDLPARSGIGSSSAFTVGLISSLCALTKGKFLGRTELANLAIDKTVSKRVYLNVPFERKDEAKELGAKWNPQKKKWYYEDKDNLQKLFYGKQFELS